MQIIVTHAPSDFDGVAAVVAASRLYPEAVPVIGHAAFPQVERYLSLYRETWDLRFPEEIARHSVDRVILVDTQFAERVEGLSTLLAPEVEWIAYDHHPCEREFSGGSILPVGAATTLLVCAILEKGLPISPSEATLYALGIYHDTGHLSYPQTKPEDVRAVAALLEQGADLTIVSEYSHLSSGQVTLFRELMENARLHSLHGFNLLTCTSENPAGPGAASAVEDLAHLYGADVTLAAIALDRTTLIVARSNSLDVRKLLLAFEGKGHPQAASARTDLTPTEAIDRLCAQLVTVLPPPLVAADLASPVGVVEPETPIDTVLEQGRALGYTAWTTPFPHRLATRAELELASHHGLGQEPIGKIATRRILVVAPETPLQGILEAMRSHPDYPTLVADGDSICGVLKRSEVLWVLETHASASPNQNLGTELKRSWPPESLEWLRRAGEMAGAQPLYLVGGAVRDLMLGITNLDIDLVTEGDAIPLAEALGDRYHIPIKTHPPFKTAHLINLEIDIATARLEYYPRPNALPVVEPSTIRQDLYRRDFTFNAMALRLNPERFGKLLDPYGGAQDLRDCVVKPLHRLSFIEDPTRILRGIRFATRLGFHFDTEAEGLARYAASILPGIGGERLKRELRRLLEEKKVEEAVELFFDLKAEQLVARGLQQPSRQALRCYRHLKRLLKGESRMWLSGLIILFAQTPLLAADAMQRLLLGENEIRVVLDGLNLLAQVREIPEQPSLRYELFKDYGPEALVALACLSPSHTRHLILDTLFRLRKVALEAANGYTLKQLGLPQGPIYRVILAEILAAKLDGIVKTPEDELEMARKLAQEVQENQEN